jgi:hypothetical protein
MKEQIGYTEGKHELIGVGELLGVSWHEAAKRYGQILWLNLIPALAALVAVLIGWFIWHQLGMGPALIAYGVVVGIAVIAYSIIAEAASLIAGFNPPHTRTTSELLSQGVRYASRIFCVGLLYAVGMFIGFVLLVVPGIWFGLRYGAALLIVIDENVGVGQAFSRSAKYTKGHVWELFLRAIAYLIIYVIIHIAVGFVLEFPLDALKAPQGVHDNVGSLVNVILAPWYVMYVVVLYRSLKAVHSKQ